MIEINKGKILNLSLLYLELPIALFFLFWCKWYISIAGILIIGYIHFFQSKANFKKTNNTIKINSKIERKNMKSYSKGKEFEEIIEKVYKLIAKNERKNVKIEKNVLMIGKNNTKNEIDILLSYESFGTIYRVAIECKNWKKTIDVKELRNFAFKLELIENINGIFISANSDFQIGAKKVTEYKQIKLIKFNELNKIIDGLDSEYLIPTSKTIGDPFWMFMDKNGYNTIKQNYFLKEGILLFESKYFAKQFQKTYLNNRGKNIELVGVSQDHLKEIIYLKKKKNIKVRMFNTYFYILNEQCNCFFDLSIEDLQMYVR